MGACEDNWPPHRSRRCKIDANRVYETCVYQYNIDAQAPGAGKAITLFKLDEDSFSIFSLWHIYLMAHYVIRGLMARAVSNSVSINFGSKTSVSGNLFVYSTHEPSRSVFGNVKDARMNGGYASELQ